MDVLEGPMSVSAILIAEKICRCNFRINSTTALYYIIKLGQIIYN